MPSTHLHRSGWECIQLLLVSLQKFTLKVKTNTLSHNFCAYEIDCALFENRPNIVVLTVYWLNKVFCRNHLSKVCDYPWTTTLLKVTAHYIIRSFQPTSQPSHIVCCYFTIISCRCEILMAWPHRRVVILEKHNLKKSPMTYSFLNSLARRTHSFYTCFSFLPTLKDDICTMIRHANSDAIHQRVNNHV